MTPQQKELVKSTWISVVPISDQAAALFYGRLFELDPALKPLFKGDMKEQGAKLMKTIGLAVSALDNLEPLIETLKDLGANHTVYGVKDAWAAAYTALAGVMKAGAAEAQAA
jgi:hemoglobin-like flavoprotein